MFCVKSKLSHLKSCHLNWELLDDVRLVVKEGDELRQPELRACDERITQSLFPEEESTRRHRRLTTDDVRRRRLTHQ